MSEQVLTDFEVVQILNTDRPKTGWAYGLCREVEAKVVSRCRAQGGNTSDESVELIDSYLEAQGITQAAANKAAEEGELPKMPALPDAWMRLSEEEGSDDYPVFINGQMHAYARDYARQAIAADRASRQVANKAEVEPKPVCTVPPDGWHCTRQPGHEGPCAAVATDDTESFTDAEEAIYQRGIEDGKAIESGMARLRAGAATPPATTGASTEDTELLKFTLKRHMERVAELEAARIAYAREFPLTEDGEPDVGNIHANIRSLKGSVGASTVLTDERIEWILRDLGVKAADRGEPMTSIAFARAIEREVAAQAGQVAVPEWVSVKDALPESPFQKVIVWIEMFYAPHYMHVGTYKDGKWSFNDSRLGQVTHWMPLPASPAKESK